MGIVVFLCFFVGLSLDFALSHIRRKPYEADSVVKDHYLVSLKSQQGVAEFETFSHRIATLELKRKYSIGDLHIVLVKTDQSGLSLLEENKEVVAIEPDLIMKVPLLYKQGEVHPGGQIQNPRQNVTGYHVSGHIPNRTSGYGHYAACHQDYIGKFGWGLIRTSFVELPNFENTPYTYGADDGSGVTIYVLDTGIKVDHEDFQGRATWGMTAANLSDEGDLDLNGHGTFVAGVAAGELFGIAKKADLVAVKVLDQTAMAPTSSIIEGIEWTMNDVKKKSAAARKRSVLNMSLGGYAPQYTLEAVLQTVVDLGFVIVTSAGNSYTDACAVSPARMSTLITVGATDNTDTFAKFSNYGPCVDILAPGVSIAGPHVILPYVIDSGTSHAAPHVTGLIARYLSSLSDQQVATLTPGMIKTHILDTALTGVVKMLNYIWLLATPNKLLHKPCVESVFTTITETDTSTWKITTSGATTTKEADFISQTEHKDGTTEGEETQTKVTPHTTEPWASITHNRPDGSGVTSGWNTFNKPIMALCIIISFILS